MPDVKIRTWGFKNSLLDEYSTIFIIFPLSLVHSEYIATMFISPNTHRNAEPDVTLDICGDFIIPDRKKCGKIQTGDR